MHPATPPGVGKPLHRPSKTALGLQRRIMLYVTCGSLFAMLFFSYIAHRALDDSTKIIFEERLHLAALVAREVEDGLASSPDGSLYLRAPDRVTEILDIHAAPAGMGKRDYHLSVVDQSGGVISTNWVVPPQFNAEHSRLLAAYLSRSEPGVVIHEPNGARSAHLVVFAPMPTLRGGIILEQGQDEALAVPRALLRQLGTLAALFLCVGLFLSWLTTRQVAGPLTKLTDITRRIAGGDLATPVPREGQDEVLDLATSFETMRRQLAESHTELAQVNRELESRVQERTAELELRHAELAKASQRLQELATERSFLLKQTIRSQEDERRRVARDLHDGVGQLLSTVVVRLSTLEAQARTAGPAVPEELSEVRALASRTVGEVRRLIVDLRPELLDDMGLAAAVAWYAETMLGKQGTTVVLDMAPTDRRLSPQAELVIFRIMQEAINNIVKHAGANHVRVDLHWEDADLVGAVDDDGNGFAGPGVGTVSGGAGVGLIGMRERVALLGGTMQIHSAVGEGTHLSFRIPIGREHLA